MTGTPDRPKCPHCKHAAHPKGCRAKAPSGCVPDTGPNGGLIIVCYRDARPPCPCPHQVCKCGLPVLIAHLTGTDLDAAMEPSPAPDGQLAVRQKLDGGLACRELADGDEPVAGEWRGREHEPWPDHGPVAAQYAKEETK